jgi:hypothetical protein
VKSLPVVELEDEGDGGVGERRSEGGMEARALEVVEDDGEGAAHLLGWEGVGELFADLAEEGPTFSGDHLVSDDLDEAEEEAFGLCGVLFCENAATLARDWFVGDAVLCAHGSSVVFETGCVSFVLIPFWIFCFFYNLFYFFIFL